MTPAVTDELAAAEFGLNTVDGQHGNLLLTVLLGTGGLGLGLQFSTLISHPTTTVPGDYAPDISGVATTTMQIGGALSVAVERGQRAHSRCAI